MASLKAPIECGICLEEYDKVRRPRVLPCAHNFCSPCLQKYISLGGSKCSICTRTYTASSVEDFPINTDFEKMVQMWTHMSVKTARTNGSSDEEDDFTNGHCSIHRKSLVYFRCKTHGIYICHQCAVIEHSPSKCDIIEIKEEMMKTKEDNLNEAQRNIDHLNSKTVTLESLIVEKNKNISNKKAQIECLLIEIDDDCKVSDQAQNIITENNNLAKQLRECSERLFKANTSKKINIECLAIKKKIEKLGAIVKEIEERTDTEKNAETLTMVSIPVSGVCAGADTGAFSSAGAGVQPVVYLDLQVAGRALGRVKIQLTCGPRRQQQMLRLCRGDDGNTWRGASFGEAWGVGEAGEHIYCLDYKDPCGIPKSQVIVQDLEEEYCRLLEEGTVAGDWSDAGFVICTRTHPSDTEEAPVLGRLVSGLELLRCAITQWSTQYTIGDLFGWDASLIMITDSGVEIPH
ncbi:unnamed protein product [Meganyctiphanes norvegica]|uniref:RING-type domain-containing protein n=1 Tax=Meganyctiphanes norvegica TaxID=48144 RepID=A0AAV2QIP3_MEGNR